MRSKRKVSKLTSSILIAALFLHLAALRNHAEQIYKCRDKNGKLTFKSTPCLSGETSEKPFASESPRVSGPSSPAGKPSGGSGSSPAPASPSGLPGGSPPAGTEQRVPPPALSEPEVAVVEHAMTADGSGNAVIHGKLLNKGKGNVPAVNLEVIFGLTNGSSRTVKSNLTDLRVGETRDFEVKTEFPIKTVVRYYIGGIFYKYGYYR
ncbi:MAG: DUF4124 domain-containing protein [Nitrospinae bacterium]|nr:DUF4124 domain-containing protein [Nitrospinota bacterium]